VFVC